MTHIARTQLGVCTILRDPDQAAGFPAGAHLQGLYPTLRLGHFSPGTLLQLPDGHRYRVRGAPGSPQRLERVR